MRAAHWAAPVLVLAALVASTIPAHADTKVRAESTTVTSTGITTTFNDPQASATSWDNIDELKRLIDGAKPNSTIQFAIYSLQDGGIVNRLIWTNRYRQVKVQIVVRESINDPATSGAVAAYDKLAGYFGINPNADSFIYRCVGACRGPAGSVNSMHHKFFLFSDTIGGAKFGFGSFNVGDYARTNQWNDLIVGGNNPCVQGELGRIFNELRTETVSTRGPKLCGSYYLLATPQPTRNLFLEALENTHCTPTSGGAGVNGKTLVLVHMSYATGTKVALKMAQRLKVLHDHGCVVKVAYGPTIGARIRALLSTSEHYDWTKDVAYTHIKGGVISGVYKSNRNARYVFTGSAPFHDGLTQGDDLEVRVDDTETVQSYIKQFAQMTAAYAPNHP